MDWALLTGSVVLYGNSYSIFFQSTYPYDFRFQKKFTIGHIYFFRLPFQMKKPTGLRIIAFYKLFHGFLLFGVSFGIFHLVHVNLDDVAREFLAKTRLDSSNRQIQFILEKFVNLSPKTIETFGVAALLSSTLTLIEGFGLWFGKRWAEYLVILGTGIFLPWEIYHIIRHPTPIKLGFFAINLIIVAYLVVVVLNPKSEIKREEPTTS